MDVYSVKRFRGVLISFAVTVPLTEIEDVYQSDF